MMLTLTNVIFQTPYRYLLQMTSFQNYGSMKMGLSGKKQNMN